MTRLLFAALAIFLVAAEPAQRLRVIIETDAGADPYDEQSLVRWLLYVNEWDVEGSSGSSISNPVRTAAK